MKTNKSSWLEFQIRCPAGSAFFYFCVALTSTSHRENQGNFVAGWIFKDLGIELRFGQNLRKKSLWLKNFLFLQNTLGHGHIGTITNRNSCTQILWVACSFVNIVKNATIGSKVWQNPHSPNFCQRAKLI